MNPWKITYDKFDPEKENLREALCTLGNGYLGTRGATAETLATKVHYPGTYIAGVYNTLVTPIAGRGIENEDFVNCPNWLLLNYRIGHGPWFDRLKVKILSWKSDLNMRKGILSRRIRWQDDQGRITLVESHRIVSMSNPHYATLRCTITPENYDGEITVRSGIDGLIINAGVERYKQLSSRHLEPGAHGTFGEDGVFLQMKTNQSNIEISEALRTLVYKSGERIKPKMNIITHGRQRIIQEFKINVARGEKYTVDKVVSIYTSRDQGIVDSCTAAQESASRVVKVDDLYKTHIAKWKALWKKFDIQVEGDVFVQQVLRLHVFHLLQSASTYNEDIDAGLPARGLHGEAYRGHIFWDELYVFPFYNLHAPEITRALLMYRYRRLNAAREYAKEHGHKGAMYPWQSASTGGETTQEVHLNPMSGAWGPDYSSLQRHVSLAVAYNVWTYFSTTGDRDFLDRYGAEMLLEIMHFWSSITEFNSQTGRYEINGVMGPDEFHEKYPGSNKGGLRNNAYTNVLVVWLINKILELLGMLSDEDKNALILKAGVSEEEIEMWKDISTKMTISIDENGIIDQFEGYRKLTELNWDEYREKYENIHRIDRILKAEGLSPDSYQVSKQADLLMLFYVLSEEEISGVFKQLGYNYNKDTLRKNFDYYIKRTSHGSTLSRVVHAYGAKLLGDKEVFKEFFDQALESDIYDTQGGTTHEGIHCGVMGGTINLFLSGVAGLSIKEDMLCFDPAIPDEWQRVTFHVRYKNIWFEITIDKKKISILAEPLKAVSMQVIGQLPIQIRGRKHKILPGKIFSTSL